jgi:ubiquinol-cytochrome c reductase cytochrome b subunit
VVGSGPWVRALHLYASQMLPLALAAHLAQMLWRGEHARRPVAWVAAVLLLALVLANGATGYSLPWDARAFYSTRIAENIVGGLPLVGARLRLWLLGGAELSTLTLSRFYALHVLVVPALILSVVCARLFVFREPDAAPDDAAQGARAEARPHDNAREVSEASWWRAQMARHAVVAGLVFALLALYASRFPAPLGPPADAVPPGYLPRPGAQFLWLFQLLKYFSTTVASLVALLLPTLLLGALALLPFRRARRRGGATVAPTRKLGFAIFAVTLLLVAALSAVAYFEDARDPRTREQLAAQARQEEEFRQAPFTPRRTDGARRADEGATAPPAANNDTAAQTAPPEAYTRNCAKCHGARGEGRSIYPPLVGVSAQPRRTVADIVAILNNPSSYGLERRMPSFAKKLSNEEKRVVAEWVASLK